VEAALWVVQVLVALIFAGHGYTLLFTLDRMRDRPRSAWTRAVSDQLLRTIGVLEVLAAIGLILPVLTHVLPWLTALAAASLVVLMVLAIAFHLRRSEWPNIGLNAILLALAAFIAYGRLVIVPV
jgi:uncharacterized membrane protein YphA (DoxX/SURF4 family)